MDFIRISEGLGIDLDFMVSLEGLGSIWDLFGQFLSVWGGSGDLFGTYFSSFSMPRGSLGLSRRLLGCPLGDQGVLE